MILPLLLAAAAPAPSPAELRASITALVSFGTRHTLSSATDPRRGIGAARTWAARRFEAISKDCGGCLAVGQRSARPCPADQLISSG